MNKKSQIVSHIKENRYCSLNEIVKLTGLARGTAVKYLQQLKSEKIIFSAGRGFYTSVSRDFVYPKNSRVSKLSQIIRKKFPSLDFVAWNTLYFQPYYHHQQAHNITFIEVEYDGLEPVLDAVSRFYRYVFVDTKSKEIPAGFDITKDPVIVRRIISRSPRKGNAPGVEKMLVDLFAVKNKYGIMSDADYWQLWETIFSLYRINIPELLDYTSRRRNIKILFPQMTENKYLKKVINGSK